MASRGRDATQQRNRRVYASRCVTRIAHRLSSMPVHHATARKLATPTEWTLLSSSFSRAITAKSFTVARLRKMLARAQQLHDKYRDRNSPVKQEMFADAVARFEARLHKITPTLGSRLSHGVDERPPRESDAVMPSAERLGTDSRLAHEAAESITERAHSETSRGARRQMKFSRQSAQAHQGHVGSRTRHRQAARDAR